MKKAIRCIAFLLILFFVIIRAYDILSWKDTSEAYLSSTKQLYSTEDDLMDVVFLGSSHCYCGISPDVLWGNYGISAFNMTTSGQDKISTYYLLKETLKTQSPDVVCVELWGLTFDEHGVQGNVYRNMLAMELSQNAVDLVKAYVDEEEWKNYLLRWPIIHTRYKELDKYDFVQMEYSEFGRGLPMTYHIGKSSFPAEEAACEEIGELTDTNREWLDNLYQLSLEEDFELVLFLTPTALDGLENQMQVNATELYAEENGITFINFNDLVNEIQIDYSRDFIDTTHLNGRGAAKITDYLGTYMDEHFSLIDHRGEDAYYQWEQSYTYYKRTLDANILQESATLDEYIARLKKMDDITYIFSFEGTYDESTLNLKRAAKAFGLTDEQYETGGTFICIDGELEFVMDNKSEEVAIYEMNGADAFKIQNMELVDSAATNLDDIMLNLESVGSAHNGLCIVVYDNVKETVIDKRGYY